MSESDRNQECSDLFDKLNKLHPGFMQRKAGAGTVLESIACKTNRDIIHPESPEADRMRENLEACIECVTPIPVLSNEDVRPGDHIIYAGRIYDHHAIVVGTNPTKGDNNEEVDLELVHSTNSAIKATVASFYPFEHKAYLRKCSESINLKKRKVMVCKYQSNIPQYPPDEIVKRALAEAEAHDRGKKGEYDFRYDLFGNNCEHFVTWCVTGKKLSIQVRKFGMVFGMFIKTGFRGISDESQRNEKEYEQKMLWDACYERNKQLLRAEKKEIRNRTDVNIGDIIMYSYFYLWHCAVVLEINKEAKDFIKCKIAHYAFCGFLSHRTIREDEITVPFNGSVYVITYSDSDFNVFSPAEVVSRAKSRVGEQLFSFFSNDSSQFTKWCKLKLQKHTQ